MKKSKKIIILFIIVISLLILNSGKKMDTIINDNIPFGQSKTIGSLGFSLGVLFKIEGKVLNEDARMQKADIGKILLEVTKVNKKKLKTPIIITYSNFSWSGINDPTPGNKFKYIGYETGSYIGIPEEAFKYLPYVATEAFHFETYFQVCKDLME